MTRKQRRLTLIAAAGLVLVVAAGLVLSAPVIGEAQVPRTVKAALIIAFTLLLLQVPGLAATKVPSGMGPFTLAVLSQLARRGEAKHETLSQAIEKYRLDHPVSALAAGR